MFSKFSQRDRKKILTASVITALLLAGWLTLAPKGLLTYYKIAKEISTISTEHKELEEQNKALREEIARLLNDSKYIEEIARKEYGFIRKNEVIFEFDKKKKK